MISCRESVEQAVAIVKAGWVEWQTKPDGFMLYLDFKFASQVLLDEFQYQVRYDQLCYGPSYGSFPKTVRVYYPLLKLEYPILEYEPCKEELCVTALASRYKPEPADEDDDDEGGASTDDESYEP